MLLPSKFYYFLAFILEDLEKIDAIFHPIMTTRFEKMLKIIKLYSITKWK